VRFSILDRKWNCPFSPGRLEELYWKEMLSLREIGVKASEILGTQDAPSENTVRKWFREQGIKTASKGRATALRSAAKTKKNDPSYSHLKGRRWAMSADQKKRLSQIRKGKKIGTKPKPSAPVLCSHCSKGFDCDVASIVNKVRVASLRGSNPYKIGLFCSLECSNAGRGHKGVSWAKYATRLNDPLYRGAMNPVLKKAGFEEIPPRVDLSFLEEVGIWRAGE
jgi:hypothetical protein